MTDASASPRRRPGVGRVLVWVLVGGFGVALFVTGFVGIVAKG